MIRNILILVAIGILPLLAMGQNGSCGTDLLHRWKMANDPLYRSAFISMEREMQTRITNMDSYHFRGSVMKVPVVVHVIHLGEPVGTGSNIPDQQIINAISGLNDRWRNFIGNSVDMTIEFCLAKIDTAGNPTNGITRVDGSGVPGYAQYGVAIGAYPGADDELIKDLSRWPREDYYNIWVVHEIGGGIGVAGYATYPTTYDYEGTVVVDNSVNYNSSTLAHELGHAFDLRHTFEGDNDTICPINTDCAADGDLICDTPPHRQGDCGNSNPCSISGIWDNSRYNYMSYCSSKDRFTPDQKTRVLAASLLPSRTTLINNSFVCECSLASDCNDFNPCTVDACSNGICTNTSIVNCVISDFPACESFENFIQCGTDCGDVCPFTNGWTNLATDSMDWTSNAGGTPSGSTGPTEDKTTGSFSGKYIYTESSSCNPYKLAIATTPGYDLSFLTNPSVKFWYNMRGANQGTLSLHIESPQGSGNWDTLFTISGDQGELWESRLIDLGAYSGNTVQFKWVGITGSGFRSDMALDDFCVMEFPSCPDPYDLEADNITSSNANITWYSFNTSATYTVEWGLSGFSPGDLSSVGLATGTSLAGLNAITVDGLTPLTDYEFYVWQSCGENDQSDMAGPYPFTTSDLIAPPACEHFDTMSLCFTSCGAACDLSSGWANLTTDSTDWTVDNDGTNSSDTGPTFDHTLGNASGRYIYVESSSPCTPDKSAILMTPSYDLRQTADPSIDFWYHMYGSDMGTLLLEIEHPEGADNWDTLITISGDQGDLWHRSFTDLSAYSGAIVRFRFTGLTGSSFHSDIALDDVCVNGSPTTCVTQGIAIDAGWNIISSYIDPSEPGMIDIFSDIADEILIVKDNTGQAYIPALGINSIGDWEVEQGYKVKAVNATLLAIGCEQVDPNVTPIPLQVGWNTIAYLKSAPMDAVAVISDIASNVLLIKNVSGASYIPAFGINGVGNLEPGQGYKVKMSAVDTLYYP